MSNRHSADSPLAQENSTQAVVKIPIASLSPEQFSQSYQSPGIPVIITDLLKPEVKPEAPWNLDYLCQQLGHQTFVLRYYGRERYQQDKRTWTSIGSGVPPQTKSFLEYADLIRNGTAHQQDIYMAKCPIADTPLAQTEAVQILQVHLARLGLTQPASGLNLWVGPAGHVEALHYDPTDGTLVQLYGRKRVVLFPPAQTANLYPFPITVHLWHGMKLRSWFSQLYPDRPDFQSFPKYVDALPERYEVILESGEALYIPVGWWHEVTALGEVDDVVCSVNRFWRVYPTQRAILSWLRWRAYLGSVFAIPNMLFQVGAACLSSDRQQKLKQIRQML